MEYYYLQGDTSYRALPDLIASWNMTCKQNAEMVGEKWMPE